MKKENFHRTIIVNASPEEAMKKISKVDKWWAEKMKGKAEKLNNTFTVDFGQTFVDFKVSELVPGKKIVWNVTDCNLHWINNKKEWKGTEVVFEISSKNGETKIDFTHIGLTPEEECYGACEKGWTDYITQSLATFINEGKGMPDQF